MRLAIDGNEIGTNYQFNSPQKDRHQHALLVSDHCSTLRAIRRILLTYVSDLHINNIKQDNFQFYYYFILLLFRQKRVTII